MRAFVCVCVCEWNRREKDPLVWPDVTYVQLDAPWAEKGHAGTASFGGTETETEISPENKG